MKKILLTNDDGVFAPGIFAVAQQLQNDYEVCIVAPDSQRSGASQSITIRKNLELNSVNIEGLEKVRAYSLSGTPADCVAFALSTLEIKPDLVVSGMNLGANIGEDVMHSGTLGAAFEATLYGYPAIAFSNIEHDAQHVADSAIVCRKFVDMYIEDSSLGKLLSVNIPDIPYVDILGIKIATLSQACHLKKYELVDDGKYYMPSWELNPNEAVETDEYIVCKNYVSVTPLLVDMCDYSSFAALNIAVKNIKL